MSVSLVGMGGVNQRRIQAKRLWDRGFGREVKAKNFPAYLESIPELPDSLLADDPEFPLLSLADPRMGLVKSCTLIGVQHAELGYRERETLPFDARHTDPTQPFWFRHDDGRKNCNRRLDHCRDECTGDILAGTALTGTFAYLHHPWIIKKKEHAINLPGSVRCDFPFFCAYLRIWEDHAELSILMHQEDAKPRYGSLRLRRK